MGCHPQLFPTASCYRGLMRKGQKGSIVVKTSISSCHIAAVFIEVLGVHCT